MSKHDFRAYVDKLEANGRLLKISEEVDTLDDLGALIGRSDYGHVEKALMFEKPKGFDIPVVANTLGSSDRYYPDAFGLPPEAGVPGVAQAFGKAMMGGGIEPVPGQPLTPWRAYVGPFSAGKSLAGSGATGFRFTLVLDRSFGAAVDVKSVTVFVRV